MTAPDSGSEAGCWLCFYGDYSGAAVFDKEIEALRYAVRKTMSVRFVRWGEDLRTGDLDD